MPGDAAGNANPGAKESDDQRVALPDDFDFPASAETHGHEAPERVVRVFDAVDDGAGAGGKLIQPVGHGFGVRIDST